MLNEIQFAIIKDFIPHFANGAEVLYLGDAENKCIDAKKLNELNIPIQDDSQLPDAVIYDRAKNRLFFIETITSHGVISPKRKAELEELSNDCESWKVYITAFKNRQEFAELPVDVAWDTDVWFANAPAHMIHFR